MSEIFYKIEHGLLFLPVDARDKTNVVSARMPGWKQLEKPIGHEVDIVRVIWPAVGYSTPAIIRNKVDLPAPFAPQIPMLSPGAIWKERLL